MKKLDVIILLSVLAVAAIVWLLLPTGAARARIFVDGKLYGEFALQGKTITIEQRGHINVIELSPGGARMAHSDCAAQDCVRQGEQSRSPIICLPNRVVVEFTGEAQPLDGVSR